jgi:hypothetical protein
MPSAVKNCGWLSGMLLHLLCNVKMGCHPVALTTAADNAEDEQLLTLLCWTRKPQPSAEQTWARSIRSKGQPGP